MRSLVNVRGRMPILAAVLAAAAALPRPGFAAGEAEEAVARVVAGLADDAARARRIVDTVKATELTAGLATGMLEKAADYAAQAAAEPAGLQAGLEALAELDKRSPEQSARWSAKRGDLCRRAFQAAPEAAKLPAALTLMDILGAAGDQAARDKKWPQAVEAFAEGLRIANTVAARRGLFELKQRVAAALLDAERRVEAYRAKTTEPSEGGAYRGKLLETLVTDMDDPAAALKEMTDQAGEPWRTYLPLAVKDAKDLPVGVCMELSKWYRSGLAAKAGEVARERMLRRARDYCQAAIAKGELKDLALVDAKTQLAAIEAELKQFDPVQGMLARLKYVDLMKLVDLETDATPDCWLFTKGVFSSSLKPGGVLAMPVDVTGDYRLSLTIAKTQKTGDVRFTFPVAGRQVGLTMREYYAPAFRGDPGGGGGRGGGRRGGIGAPAANVTWLSLAFDDVGDSRQASEANVVNPNYQARQWVPYTLELAVRVTGDTVEMATTLNAVKWVSWKGTKKDLRGSSVESGKGFTVQFTNPGLAVSAAKLRPTSGEAALAHCPKGKPPTAGPAGDRRWPLGRRSGDNGAPGDAGANPPANE